jgi:transposase
MLTGGEVADCTQAITLLEGHSYQYALMDKAYDCDNILKHIRKNNAEPVIPPKKNRKNPQDCDFFIYQARHKVECFFGYIKHYRRIFSRFDKLARNYMGFVHFASTLIWCR